MSVQTLATVFEGAAWRGAGTRLFSAADIERTADLAKAESEDETSQLVETLLHNARDRLLDLPLLDVLIGGWLRLRALQAFATEEMRASDETHEYEIAKHKVSSKHAPKVELYVHDTKIADAVLSIDLALVMANAKLLIRKGRIMEVAISGCKASATLKYGSHVLLKREAEELDFPATVKLGDGIAIPPPLNLTKPKPSPSD